MTHQLDNCPKCGEPTAYRVEANGDGGEVCTVCDWQAVEVVWFGTAREPEKL